VKLTHISENQQLNSTFVQRRLIETFTIRWKTFKVSPDYVYDHTYSLTAAYFNVYGSADAGFMPQIRSPIVQMARGLSLIWLICHSAKVVRRFGLGSMPELASPILTIGDQWRGQQFDGASTTPPRTTTIFAYAWIAF